MATKDLNIIQRGVTAGYRWSAEKGRITAADLGSIGETRTDNSGAMNALPTPFARFFVFREAFRRVLEEKNNPGDPKKQAGRAYSQLVSNTLDIFELLYNMKWHENRWADSGRKIVIREWNAGENLKVLKRNAPVLGNSVESYLKDDLGTERLFFVILQDNGKEYLLGTGSPMTGFITPPDLDLTPVKGRQNEFRFVEEAQYSALAARPLKRRYGGSYFKDCVLFGARDRDFKNYIFSLFSEASEIDGKFRELRNYVRSFENDPDIVNNWPVSSLKEIHSENNNPLKINGLKIFCDAGVGVINYLSDTLVRLPYALNKGGFTSFNKENLRSEGYSYLLPLTADGIAGLTPGGFSFTCKEGGTSVDVEFVSDGRTDKKTYYVDGGRDTRVKDLSSCGLNLSLSIFPNVLSPVPEQNSYFKIMAALSDSNGNKSVSVSDLRLEFYKVMDGRYTLIPETDDREKKFGVLPPVVRSEQGEGADCGTEYYEVFNTGFDAIRLSLNIDGDIVSAFVFPDWDKGRKTEKAFTYAVDLGTSNTYISRREKGTFETPQQLKMDKEIVAYLQTPLLNVAGTLVDNVEKSFPKEFASQIKAEFVPALIDGKRYKFPIRTALCSRKDVGKKALFDNSNIAFFYEKMKCPDNQEIDSDVKWSDDTQSLRVFIQEILLLIKADILQENGSVQDTEIIWFRPLSFKDELRRNFENIWKDEAERILNLRTPAEQIKCYTESVAPFYYFDSRGDFKNRSSVAVLDIGGGTADVVYYSDGKPEIANSVRFGCDVLWGEGYNRMKNSRENGIFLRYRDKLDSSLTPALKEIYESMIAKDSGASSRDIINFWISDTKGLEIPSLFHRDFLPVFVYHFTASLYYIASLFKANGFEYPKTLIFSGNGSRYIDGYITDDKSVLENVAGMVTAVVYGLKNAEVEIVLPEERKETTCYGGLWCKGNYKDPTPVLYAGDGCGSEYEDVADLKRRYHGGMKENVVTEVRKMNAVFIDVMNFLIKKEVAATSVELDAVSKTINSGLSASLDANFQKNVEEQYKDSEQFKDTLFFYPVVQGIFELTKLLKDAKN